MPNLPKALPYERSDFTFSAEVGIWCAHGGSFNLGVVILDFNAYGARDDPTSKRSSVSKSMIEQLKHDTKSLDQDSLEEAIHAHFEQGKKIEKKGSKRLPITFLVGEDEYRADEGEVFYKFLLPAYYQYPAKAASGEAATRVARAYSKRRHIFVYGDAGSGKSAIFRALGFDFNRECSHYAMRESLDPELYLGRTVIEELNGASVTRFEKGPLLLDFEGREGKDGVKRAVTILMDDIDRAPPVYHEIFRHAMDDNAKSIFVPELKVTITIFPGTQIIATANSSGRGDSTSLYATSQQMDESILDRFNVVVHYPFLNKEEELEILVKRFPSLPKKVISMMLHGAGLIRDAIAKGEIFGSFSHRRIVNWCQSLVDVQERWNERDMEKVGMIRHAAKDWMDWFDPEQREILRRILLPCLDDTEGAWR